MLMKGMSKYLNGNKLIRFKVKCRRVSLSPSRELGNINIAPRLRIKKKKHGTKFILRDSFMKAIIKNRLTECIFCSDENKFDI